jgi:ribonuclease HI
MTADAQRERIILFTDGAASGNPGPGGWAAVIVTPEGRVTEIGGGASHTTNNRMELTGAIEGLRQLAGNPARIAIYTDSSYVIKGITQWVWSWQRRGWKTADGGDVLNRELWEQLSALVNERGRATISWHWVRGHDGTPGNERVDQIAVGFSRGRGETLFTGPLTDYPLAILDLPDDTTPPERTSRHVAGSGGADAGHAGLSSSRKAAPYSYVSVVDGVLERHATWADCERRVKGRAGARFRKALNAADEASILRGWGFDAV